MPQTDVFETLSSTALLTACDLLSFNPVASSNPLKLLSQVALAERLRWANVNRELIQAEFCTAGSWSFGRTRTYTEVVFALAEKIGAARDGVSVADIEDAIVRKVWSDATAKMSEKEREELNRKAQETAARYGRTAKSQAAGFAALGAAQVSGFGIYMAGSTMLGAINSALGLGLGFGAFTGLSSIISTAVGPLGWAALGIFTVAKMGAPNWKKVLPVVVLIASQRAIAQTDFRPTADAPVESTPEPTVQPTTLSQAESDVRDVRSNVRVPDMPEQRLPSRMDRIIFQQTPANRELIKFSADLGCHDFLALDLETQVVIRELFEEQKLASRPVAAPTIQEPIPVRPVSADTTPLKKHSVIKRKSKEISTLLPNVELTEKAVERLLEYERDSILYTSFLQQLRAINDGLRSDKHHVPLTSPKVFQRDAGNGGRVYYRRVSPSSIRVELLGSKTTQNGDYKHLQGS